ncbi:FadR/GntR family transcriptional regulator [Povalibacter sp.]|uniref:FadR/GntR family transcriptional regulator n=1 Tax=Povalibacter sp. TaxID=1962978 RepID=UPI002F40E2EC
MSTRTKPVSRAKPRRGNAATAVQADAVVPLATNLFEPVEREPAYFRVSAAIEAKILGRVLKGGDLLPPELDLAQQFRVHRSTVREALRQLENSGLITRPPGAKRMVVSRPHADKVASGMRQALVLHEVTFVDVWEAMMIIEPEVAALAATRRTQADIEAFVRVSQAFASTSQSEPAVDLVVDFFELLGVCARNHVLVLAKHSLAQVLAPSLAQMVDRVPQARSRIIAAQQKIISALQNRDADEARKWMSKHVRDFRRGYEVAGIPPGAVVSA